MIPKASLFIALCAVSSSYATVTVFFNVDSVFTATGEFVPATGLGMLLVDVDGNGFGSIVENSNLSSGSFVGSNDLVAFSKDFSDGPGIWTASPTLTLSGAFNAGDRIAFAWFPTLTTSSSAAPASVSYGLLSDSRWVTPGEGLENAPAYQIISTNPQGFASNSNTLEIADALARAALTVGAIPEPSTFALLAGVVGLGFASSRRRRHA
jgi:hypothetical protein